MYTVSMVWCYYLVQLQQFLLHYWQSKQLVQKSEILLIFCLPSNLAKISLQTMDIACNQSSLVLELLLPIKLDQISVSDHVHGSKEIKWAQKSYASRVWCPIMHTKFGRRSLSGFGDITTLKNGQISLSDHGIVHDSQKIELNKMGSKNSCK